MTTDRPVGFYYGSGKLARLTRFDRVVLQPDAYTPAELAQLRGEGTLPLAYLSLSEDVGPPAPWQRDERNPDWGGAMVVIGDQRWVEHVVAIAEAAASEALFDDLIQRTEATPDATERG